MTLPAAPAAQAVAEAAPKLLTKKKAADLLTVSTKTVNRLVTDGQLRPVRLTGRTHRFVESDVLALIRRRQSPAAEK